MTIDVPEDNLVLYSFANEWRGTPYRFGGTSRKVPTVVALCGNSTRRYLLKALM